MGNGGHLVSGPRLVPQKCVVDRCGVLQFPPDHSDQFGSDRRGQIPSAFDAVDTDEWTLTLSGKDMAILVLMAINAVIIVAACCQSARSRSRRYGKGKYEVVAVAADSDLEDAALRQ